MDDKTKEYVIKFQQIHGNKYDYSKVQYINTSTNVEIICSIHGSFFQMPLNHLKGKGCKLCGIENCRKKRARTTDDFIKMAKLKYGDTYDYSMVIYKNHKSYIKIKCNQCGNIFEQRPVSHLYENGCKKCSSKNASLKQTMLFDDFVIKANKIHNNRYTYSNDNFKTIKSEITIICPKHGIFKKKGTYHLQGSGCPDCSSIRTVKKNIIIIEDEPSKTDQFIAKAKKIHGDTYNYSETEYVNSNTNIKIICSIHGVFTQLPFNHLKGGGCKACGKENSDSKQTFTIDDFIKKAKDIHGDKYDYSKSIYVNYNTKIEITCPKHGSFFQLPSNHISGKRGCIKCRDDTHAKKHQYTLEEFIQRANKIHNNRYDYSKVDYKGSRKKVEIICNNSKHGSFFQTPKSHLQKFGCPKCAKNNFSLKAITWLDHVAKEQNIYIQHAMNKGEYKLPGTNIKVDGFCEKSNTVYQFHGIFYHGNPQFYKPSDVNPICKKTFGELYIKTLTLDQTIRDLGYNLIIMWEHEWNLKLKTMLNNT